MDAQAANDPTDDFRSISELVRKLDDDELRIMHEGLQDLTQQPGWAILRRLLLLERETQVRRLAGSKILEHTQYAQVSGLVRGLAAPWAAIEKVASTHRRVQEQLAREAAADRDGES